MSESPAVPMAHQAKVGFEAFAVTGVMMEMSLHNDAS
jgi:hypothetical protein